MMTIFFHTFADFCFIGKSVLLVAPILQHASNFICTYFKTIFGKIFIWEYLQFAAVEKWEIPLISKLLWSAVDSQLYCTGNC